jgi:hypothetical protein
VSVRITADVEAERIVNRGSSAYDVGSAKIFAVSSMIGVLVCPLACWVDGDSFDVCRIAASPRSRIAVVAFR